MDLAPCPNCRRHVAASETCCPFCTVALAVAAPRVSLVGRASRAMVFGAALSAASCGGQPKPTEAPRSQQRGGGCDGKPDEAQIEKLEKMRAAAKTDEDRALIDTYIEDARHPVCNPYGAPPKRRRAV